MLLLCADLETSDLPKGDLPPGDPGQPWIVAVAAQIATDEGEIRDFFYTRVRADGRRIRPGAERVHGITSSAAGRNGVSETAALGMLIGFAAQATHVIAHGAQFERTVVENNLIRLEKKPDLWVRPGLQFVCTMLAAAPVCRIPSEHESGGFRWPSLDDCCEIILGLPRRTGPHSAWDDMQLTWKLFLALRERQVLEIAA